MAKVVMFPQKKKLPEGVEKRLGEVAKDYVGVLRAAVTLMELEGDKPTDEEIMNLVGEAFAKGILEAIDEMFEL